MFANIKIRNVHFHNVNNLKSTRVSNRVVHQTPRFQFTTVVNALHKATIDEIAKNLKIKNSVDWAKVSSNEFKKNGGADLFKEYGGVLDAVQKLYPDQSFPFWSFKSSSSKVPEAWKDEANQNRFITHLAEKLNIKKAEDWLFVDDMKIEQLGAKPLLDLHKQPIHVIVGKLPQFRLSDTFWTDKTNRRAIVDRAATMLNVKNLDDWYTITLNPFSPKALVSLVNYHYSGNLPIALRDLYPEHPWKLFKFNFITKSHWFTEATRKSYLEEVARELKHQQFSDWYEITPQQIQEYKLGPVLHYYGNSIIITLATLYPENAWRPWSFKHIQVPPGFWDNKTHQKRFMDWLATEFKLKQPEDWFRVKVSEVKRLGGSTILNKYTNFLELLKNVYPEQQWKLPDRFEE